MNNLISEETYRLADKLQHIARQGSFETNKDRILELGYEIQEDIINQYEKEIQKLQAKCDEWVSVAGRYSDFLGEIAQFGYVQCAAHDEGAGCYLISAKEFDEMREQLSKLEGSKK
jgi:hypothetical protein